MPCVYDHLCVASCGYCIPWHLVCDRALWMCHVPILCNWSLQPVCIIAAHMMKPLLPWRSEAGDGPEDKHNFPSVSDGAWQFMISHT